jgi:hypothetical protein
MPINLSGSLVLTGSITATGGITMSGSIDSASFASNATSASYALNSTSASFATNTLTASSADAFTVRNTLTAQTLVVQTITSSVDFVTGSTRFGSILGNTHQFTGSVGISGSLTSNGALSGTSATFSSNITNVSALYVRASGNSDLPFINFSNADGVYNWGRIGGLLQGDGDGSLYFQTKLGGSLGTRLTIISTGAATFSSTIQTNGNAYILPTLTGGGAGGGLYLGVYPDTQYSKQAILVERYTSTSGNYGRGSLHFCNRDNADANLPTLADSRMIITSDGNVLIGTGTTPEGPLDVYKSNSAGLGGHILLRNNGAAVGNETAVLFVDGGVGSTRAAISSTTEGSPYFGNIKFKTGATAYASLNTRMTITGAGNVGIGTTNPLGILSTIGGAVQIMGDYRNHQTIIKSSGTSGTYSGQLTITIPEMGGAGVSQGYGGYSCEVYVAGFQGLYCHAWFSGYNNNGLSISEATILRSSGGWSISQSVTGTYSQGFIFYIDYPASIVHPTARIIFNKGGDPNAAEYPANSITTTWS